MKTAPAQRKTVKINSICLLSNHRSTNQARARRLYQEACRLLPDAKRKVIELIDEKSSPTEEERIVRAAKTWDSRTLVCIGGGDGTVSKVIQTILTSPDITKKAKRAILLPLWGGNANDIAVMLNGYPNGVNIADIIKSGQPTTVNPLSIRLQSKGNIRERLAVSYVSFGGTAYALWLMENYAHKRDKSFLKLAPVRFLAEIAATLNATFRSPAFELENKRKRRAVYDRIFTNGSRLAKMEGLPVALNRREFYDASLHRKHLFYIWYILQAFIRHKYGSVRRSPQQFIIRTPTRGQIDGELLKVAANTKTEIGIHPEGVAVLSTKLTL